MNKQNEDPISPVSNTSTMNDEPMNLNTLALSEHLAQSNFSDIYSVRSRESQQANHILKINSKQEMHDHEVKVMTKLNALNSSLFPKMINEGSLSGKKAILQQRLGPTLYSQLHGGLEMTKCQVNKVAIQLITCLEEFHKTGFVYNDLKADNICIGNFDKTDC